METKKQQRKSINDREVQVSVYLMHIRITCLFSVITNITASDIDRVYFQHFKFMWSTPGIRRVAPPIPYCFVEFIFPRKSCQVCLLRKVNILL